MIIIPWVIFGSEEEGSCFWENVRIFSLLIVNCSFSCWYSQSKESSPSTFHFLITWKAKKATFVMKHITPYNLSKSVRYEDMKSRRKGRAIILSLFCHKQKRKMCVEPTELFVDSYFFPFVLPLVSKMFLNFKLFVRFL
jgi:hypothetical protein